MIYVMKVKSVARETYKHAHACIYTCTSMLVNSRMTVIILPLHGKIISL